MGSKEKARKSGCFYFEIFPTGFLSYHWICVDMEATVVRRMRNMMMISIQSLREK